jgi:hypothetical protein
MKDQFMPGVTEKLGWYVYLLTDPRNNNEVFYVGKGSGNRCFAHVAEARQTQADVALGYEKLNRIREIEASDGAVGIDILSHGLTEDESLKIEAAAIDLLGLVQLTNRIAGHGAATRGRMSVTQIHALYAKPVEIDPDHSVVLINIRKSYWPGISDADLYERTRMWWPIAEARRQIGAAGAPVWAFAVAGGVVRAVYRITAWERPSAADIAEHPSLARRWRFHGTQDHEMEERYVFSDVSRYITSQWPLRFVTPPVQGGSPPVEILTANG